MNFKKLPFLLIILSLALFTACGSLTDDENNDSGPDYAITIVGQYSFTTYSNNQQTGSGNAIISKLSNNKILIGTDQGIQLEAVIIESVGNGLAFEIPEQNQNYYNIPAVISGTGLVSNGNTLNDAFYFSGTGQLRASIQIKYSTSTDAVILELDR